MNLINVPLATSATFRKLTAAKERIEKDHKAKRAKTDASTEVSPTESEGLVDRLCHHLSHGKKGASAGDVIKSTDIINEECISFEDTVTALDGEDSRPKTVLDDVLCCLDTAMKLVLAIYAKQSFQTTDDTTKARLVAMSFRETNLSALNVIVPNVTVNWLPIYLCINICICMYYLIYGQT